MADDSPAGRRRALKRAGFVSAGLLVVFVVVLLVVGEPDFALILAVFGPLMGVTVFDASRCRIELRRYRDAYGELPPEDDGR
jgi:Flp pilus assembly protein TadB